MSNAKHSSLRLWVALLAAQILFSFGAASRAAAFTASDANAMVSSYNSAFYFTTNGNRGYFRNTTEGGTTWFLGTRQRDGDAH
jgi:hypothetical protein